MQLPTILPTLLNKGFDETISLMLQEPDNHFENMVRLSKICKVKLTFNCPTVIYTGRRKSVTTTEHIFNGFFLSSGGNFCYTMKSTDRRGYILPQAHIESYEPVIKTVDAFDNYEQFRKKFDTQFITEEAIKKLWDSTSAQHGGKYLPSDFKSIGPAGKEALYMFLRGFKGVTSTDSSTYDERTSVDGTYKYFNRSNCSYGSGGSHTSRDIRISHTLGNNCVSYSSEYSGTGNGTYGLLATKSTYLWLEND